MSTITLIIKDIHPSAEALSRIRQVTGQSFAEIQRRIQSGTALIEYVLFMNDHDEVADRLRGLLTVLSQVGADFRIFESDDNVAGRSLPEQGDEIDAVTLENILAGHEEGRRLRQLDDLGHC